jgi:hypothetical protein
MFLGKKRRQVGASQLVEVRLRRRQCQPPLKKVALERMANTK